jgi:hypothetical protein
LGGGRCGSTRKRHRDAQVAPTESESQLASFRCASQNQNVWTHG